MWNTDQKRPIALLAPKVAEHEPLVEARILKSALDDLRHGRIVDALDLLEDRQGLTHPPLLAD